MKFFCPAKINLFLKIVEKLENGYHSLESVFAFLDLYDELSLQKSDKFKIEIEGEFAQLVDQNENCFTKILDFFADKFSIDKKIEIKIKKSIPVGAGLGGGSSDAAFFIGALNKIFSLNLSKENLQKISLNFGSDIAFFFEGKSSIIRKRGDEIADFKSFEPISTLLVNPKIHLSTPQVYSKFDQNFSSQISNDEIRNMKMEDILNLPNDLTKPAISALPLIEEIMNDMKNLNAKFVKMSGSGATCFAIFEKDSDLDFATKRFEKDFPDFFIRKTKILSSLS